MSDGTVCDERVYDGTECNMIGWDRARQGVLSVELQVQVDKLHNGSQSNGADVIRRVWDSVG